MNFMDQIASQIGTASIAVAMSIVAVKWMAAQNQKKDADLLAKEAQKDKIYEEIIRTLTSVVAENTKAFYAHAAALNSFRETIASWETEQT